MKTQETALLLTAIVRGIADGSIISNTDDYLNMIDVYADMFEETDTPTSEVK